jgi:hypothetical protein
VTRYYAVPRRYRARSRVPGRSVAAVAAGAVVLSGAVRAGHAPAGHAPAPASVAAAPPLTVAVSPAGRVTSGPVVSTGLAMAARYGWTGQQALCLNWLWTRESGWRLVWNYGGSGAFGIPQALPASKMASAGPDYMTSPVTEIRWGLGYIAERYGTPCNAWKYETDKGWY